MPNWRPSLPKATLPYPADVRQLPRRGRKSQSGNAHAQEVLQSWADGEWFCNRPDPGRKITVAVFKVTGETNTDDLSPAPDAWSRPDIPLHALAMLKNGPRRHRA